MRNSHLNLVLDGPLPRVNGSQESEDCTTRSTSDPPASEGRVQFATLVDRSLGAGQADKTTARYIHVGERQQAPGRGGQRHGAGDAG
jgi:hypothetical protein